MSKVLVAYFSASGVTAGMAEKLAKEIKADLFQIEPEVPYTNADLNWGNSKSRSSVEMNDKSCRPAISSQMQNMNQYDVVFVGFPVWWYREPSIIDTFMESYDFSEKTIVPFCTSGGSGIGSSARNLHSLVASDTIWLDGERLSSGSSRDDMVSWINGLGLDVTAE